MTYDRTRSLCFNVAAAMGMPEYDMRKAVNAKNHVKILGKDVCDVIEGMNGEVVMISLRFVTHPDMGEGEKRIPDYMVSEIDDGRSWQDMDFENPYQHFSGGNSLYFDYDKEPHMNKVKALLYLSELTGGEMHPLEGW